MQLSEQIAMVLLVFALLGGLLWFSKKRGFATLPIAMRRSGPGRRLEVLERVSLTPQHALHLVRLPDRTVVIATAPTSCALLDALAAGEAFSSALSSQSRDLLRSGQ